MKLQLFPVVSDPTMMVLIMHRGAITTLCSVLCEKERPTSRLNYSFTFFDGIFDGIASYHCVVLNQKAIPAGSMRFLFRVFDRLWTRIADCGLQCDTQLQSSSMNAYFPYIKNSIVFYLVLR